MKKAFKLTPLKKTIFLWSLVFLPTIIVATKAYAPVLNDNWARGGLLYHWFRRLAENTQLITAIEEFMDTWNRNPKPFVWTATVDSIVEKPQRCRQTLENI